MEKGRKARFTLGDQDDRSFPGLTFEGKTIAGYDVPSVLAVAKQQEERLKR